MEGNAQFPDIQASDRAHLGKLKRLYKARAAEKATAMEARYGKYRGG
jgi:hypothetical protein